MDAAISIEAPRTRETGLTAEYLRSRVMLEAETQRFIWLLHPGSANGNRAWDKQWAGKEVSRRHVSAPSAHGYQTALIRLNGRWYAEHRLIWLFMTGAWPKNEIDHINGDPTDNRFENLREATHAQNQRNKGPMRNNLLGVKGVGYRRNRFYAQISVGRRDDGRKKVCHIGTFGTIEEASAAYRKVAAEMHGEFLHESQKYYKDQ